MKKSIIALSLFCSIGLYADSWSNAARKIPVQSGQWVNAEVFPAFDATSNRPLVAWIDYSNRRPFYSVYDGKNWRQGMQISKLINLEAKGNVFLSHDPNARGVIAIWVDIKTSVPTFAVFNGSTWTSAATIAVGSKANGAFRDVFLAFDPAIGNTIAVWPNQSHLPVYSLFDGTNWTSPLPLPLGASSGAASHVMLSYETGTGHMVAAWANITDHAPYYSVFDGKMWSVAAQIPQGNSQGALIDVSLAYHASIQETIAAWTDTATHTPYFSQLGSSGWSAAAPIPLGNEPTAYGNVALAYHPGNKSIFAAWGGDASCPAPCYSMFNGTNWTAASVVPQGFTAGTRCSPYLAYDAYYMQMVMSWPCTPYLEASYSFY